nr:MAG TPA: hypothetical protein [Bacteriophage sp.]
MYSPKFYLRYFYYSLIQRSIYIKLISLIIYIGIIVPFSVNNLVGISTSSTESTINKSWYVYSIIYYQIYRPIITMLRNYVNRMFERKV